MTVKWGLVASTGVSGLLFIGGQMAMLLKIDADCSKISNRVQRKNDPWRFNLIIFDCVSCLLFINYFFFSNFRFL